MIFLQIFFIYFHFSLFIRLRKVQKHARILNTKFNFITISNISTINLTQCLMKKQSPWSFIEFSCVLPKISCKMIKIVISFKLSCSGYELFIKAIFTKMNPQILHFFVKSYIIFFEIEKLSFNSFSKIYWYVFKCEWAFEKKQQ